MLCTGVVLGSFMDIKTQVTIDYGTKDNFESCRPQRIHTIVVSAPCVETMKIEELRALVQNLIDELGVNERVKLLGTDKNPFKFIKNASCFVCASRFEGFSNVLLEALACEKFVISTDHQSGARELLGDDEFGILTPVDDEQAMKNAMKIALEDERIRQNFEKIAYNRAKSFDSAQIAQKLIKFLENDDG